MIVEINQLCRRLRLDCHGALWHDDLNLLAAYTKEHGGAEISSTAKRFLVLRSALEEFLYLHYYVCGGYGAIKESSQLHVVRANARVQRQQLRAISDASRRLDYQIAVREPMNDRRGGVGLHRNAMGENGPASRKGARGMVRMTNDVRSNLAATFFFVPSKRPLQTWEGTTRIYINVDECDRVELARRLYIDLSKLGTAFDFKVMTGSENTPRCDNIVVYCLRSDCGRVCRSVLKTVGITKFLLGTQVPLWTYKLRLGVAAADGLTGGASFGRSRCESLSSALLHSFRDRDRKPKRSVVVTELRKAGLNFERPYLLDSTSTDVYRPINVSGKTQHDRLQNAKPRSGGDFTEVPQEKIQTTLAMIARNIWRSAIRTQRRITWIISKPSLRQSIGGANTSAYSGLAGIALFFGEYWLVSADASARSRARKIWTEIFLRLQASEEKYDLSLLTGTVGTVLIGIRLSRLLSDDEIFEQAKEIFHKTLSKSQETANEASDWLNGIAGTISGLTSASEQFEAQDCVVELAATLRECLRLRAKHCKRGVYWKGKDKRFRPMLGMAHGISGIALALAFSNRSELLSLARGGFEYEDSFFSKHERAWPVFRDGRVSYHRAWCHGSAGILLSRKFANESNHQIFPWKKFYSVALKNLLTATTAALSERASLCLCHGVAGNAEIVRTCDSRTNLAPIVDRVCTRIQNEIAAVEKRRITLDPSLMLGLSGVGLFLIRILKPAVPSPLVLGTPHWLR